ncbi:MAG: hypothetical protein IKP07_06120 [Bacilli bacterium]|nr:hypothetical protein [Bacilli bacterium]
MSNKCFVLLLTRIIVRSMINTGKRKEKGEIMRKEMIQNLAGVVLFYLIIVLGVIAVNARMEQTQDMNPVVSLNG